MKRINYEIRSFIFIGFTTVFLDFLIYKILLNLNFLVFLSKGISFFFGAIFAYFANKKLTFNARGGNEVFLRFILVYATALFLNVIVNNQILYFFRYFNHYSQNIAFTISTLFSAVYNFIGLKKFVFQRNKNK